MDMRCLVNLIGRLGKDATIKNFSYKDSKTKQKVDSQLVEISLATHHLKEPSWHNVVAYGESYTKALGKARKGDKLMVTGYLRYDRVKKGDLEHTITKIIVQGYELMTINPSTHNASKP